jgi:WG containing repeat
VIILPKFDTIRIFFENRAAFKKDNKWGFIDADGNVVIRPQFEEVTNFVEGRAIFRKDSKFGAIDASGQIVIEPNIDDIYSAYEQLDKWFNARVHSLGGYIDRTGHAVVPPLLIPNTFILSVAKYRKLKSS